MIGKLNHVAIAVPDLNAAIENYKTMLGAVVSKKEKQKEHGVTIAFITLSNTKIELISPLGEDSPLKNFLLKNPNGGIHHICYEVKNIIESKNALINSGAKIVGNGEPKLGAHGKLVLFLAGTHLLFLSQSYLLVKLFINSGRNFMLSLFFPMKIQVMVHSNF